MTTPTRPGPRWLHERPLRTAARASDSYGLLLCLLLVDYLLVFLVDSPRWSGLVVSVPLSLTLLLAYHTSHAPHRAVRLAGFAVPLAVVVGAIQASTADPRVVSAVALVDGVLLVLTPVAILRRVFGHERVGVETVLGAICVYVVIGLIFAQLYIGIAHASSTPFLAQPGPHPSSDYVYLSYVTLTTVGFGDLTPLTKLARSVVSLEGMVGQVFLVTLVARLVSLFGEKPRFRG